MTRSPHDTITAGRVSWSASVMGGAGLDHTMPLHREVVIKPRYSRKLEK
jgi:hypothetical protein